MKIPIVNIDTENVWLYIQRKINRPESQCTMVLVVVSMALLLDNMLYMVIVPIVPYYLAYIALKDKTGNDTVNWIKPEGEVGHYELNWVILQNESKEVGLLFASKAIVQLMVNPLSGTVIDRIGYDIPMMIGLIIIFMSTIVFAMGQNAHVLFIARGLQGVGSAFADTSGLAMIADRFTEEASRTKALGIALAFISFGSLVAPPFGGILYQYAGKEFPFLCLASLALFDGFLLIIIMKPVRLERRELQAEGSLPKGTPIQKLFMDPYIAICAGCLTIANVSLAFLEPTITSWMLSWHPAPTKAQTGLIWLPAFIPHVAGVYTTVKLSAKYPQYQWLMAGVGLALEGVSCVFIPFCSSFVALMIPISVLCYGIALVDTAILPTLGYLVDTRHVSVYGSIYAIADISYSVAYAIGPIVAGSIVTGIGFTSLNFLICIISIAYVPVLYLLRNTYQYGIKKIEDDDDDIKPGRKKSYLMNGASLESKNVENIHNQEPKSIDAIMEKESLVLRNEDHNPNTNPTSQSTYSTYSSMGSGNTRNYTPDGIKSQQYGY